MALADILRNGVALANTLTESVQGTCRLEAWIAQDGKGKSTYASSVNFKAVVDYTRKQRWSADGRTIVGVATLTVLTPVTPNGAAGRREPIDPRDRITLPDGMKVVILETPGAVLDPPAGRPFIHEIFVGEPNSNR